MINMITKTNALKVLLCSFLLVSTQSFSQDTASSVEVNKAAKRMFVDMNNRDYDAILEMCHPKLFDLASKDQIKAVFKTTFEGNEEFSIYIPKTIPPYKVSEVFKEDKENLEYAFVSYDMNMKMTFHNQKFDEQAKKMMATSMKTQGMDVKFESDNVMDVMMNDRITVILKDNTTKNKWVMMNYDSQSPLVYQLFPTSILEKVKKHKENLLLERKKKK